MDLLKCSFLVYTWCCTFVDRELFLWLCKYFHLLSGLLLWVWHDNRYSMSNCKNQNRFLLYLTKLDPKLMWTADISSCCWYFENVYVRPKELDRYFVCVSLNAYLVMSGWPEFCMNWFTKNHRNRYAKSDYLKIDTKSLRSSRVERERTWP